MRCVVVDDSAIFIDAARRLLERDGITVVGTASSTAEALQCVDQLRPDVVLVDVDLGEEDGFALTEHLHRSGVPAPPPVILMSAHDEQDFADMIAASSALGFIPKSAFTPDAVRDLLEGPGTLQR